MKFVTIFLVLSLVVLMAEPGDAFFHHIFKGIMTIGRSIHGLIRGRSRQQGFDQFDERALNQERNAVN